MEKIRIIDFQGQKIVYLNFSGLKTKDGIRAVINESTSVIRNNPPKSVCTISNIRGMHFNHRIKEIFTEFTSGNRNFIKASAIVGASGLQDVMINGLNVLTGRKLKSFSDEDTAKKWLALQN